MTIISGSEKVISPPVLIFYCFVFPVVLQRHLHYLLAFIVLMKVIYHSYLGSSVCNAFSLAAFKIFSVSLVFIKSFYDLEWVFLCLFLLGINWTALISELIVFIKFGKLGGNISLNTFSFPPTRILLGIQLAILHLFKNLSLIVK